MKFIFLFLFLFLSSCGEDEEKIVYVKTNRTIDKCNFIRDCYRRHEVEKYCSNVSNVNQYQGFHCQRYFVSVDSCGNTRVYDYYGNSYVQCSHLKSSRY
jgi:predicted P-loop ATPase/GTPase